MKLKDFNTLAEAQAYKEISYKPVSAGIASQFFGITGMLDALEANFATPNKVRVLPTLPETSVGALCRTVVNSANNKGFATDPNEKDGYINREGAQRLVEQGVFMQPLVDDFWKMGEVETQPYKNATQAEFDEAKDTGETIALPANNNHHTATISIATQPLKPIDIVVEQRFSKDGIDWTEWHSVGAFRNVDYPQRSYEASIVASPAQHRELRAISPLTLGVEVA